MHYGFLVSLCSICNDSYNNKWPKHLYENISRELANSRQISDFIKSDGFGDMLKDTVKTSISEDTEIKHIIKRISKDNQEDYNG